MKKIIFMIIAMSLLSGCRCYFTTGCPATKKEREIYKQCDEEIFKKYANDNSEEAENNLGKELVECYNSRYHWWSEFF